METKNPPTLRELERETIIRTLEGLDYQITTAARLLGLSRAGLYSKIKIHKIPLPRKDDDKTQV